MWEFCLPYWRGFQALSPGRQLQVFPGGGGQWQRLAYADLSRYAADHGLADDPAELDDFVALFRRMEDVWLELNQITSK